MVSQARLGLCGKIKPTDPDGLLWGLVTVGKIKHMSLIRKKKAKSGRRNASDSNAVELSANSLGMGGGIGEGVIQGWLTTED